MSFSLGSWRFLLSFLVAISHLYKDMLGGPAAYAVWGFFVLSGFLMTEILRNKYGFTKQGLLNYAFNRSLRIFPAYWVALGFGAVTIVVLSSYNISLSTILNPEFYFPQNVSSWFANVTLIPFFNVDGRLIPVSHALAVEVGVYILIPLMAINKSTTWIALILSLLLSMQYSFEISSFAQRYSLFLTSLFAFSIGSLVSHYKNKLHVVKAPLLSISIWIIHCFIILFISSWPWTYGIYASALLSAWVVISFADVKGNKWDKLLGDLSYPIYLFHTTVAAWMLLVFAPDRSFLFFLISFIITIGLSWVILKLIDEPLHKVKMSSKSNRVLKIVQNNIFTNSIKSFFLIVRRRIMIHKINVLIATVVLTLFLALWQGYKIVNNDTLSIKSWGPQYAKVLVVPNMQPSGEAGIWIKTDTLYGLGELKVLINGEPAEKTVIGTNVITALVAPKYFDQVGKIDIVVEQVMTGKRIIVGTVLIEN